MKKKFKTHLVFSLLLSGTAPPFATQLKESASSDRRAQTGHMVTTRSITDHPTDHHQATDHHHHSADHDQNIDQDPRMGMINDHDVDQI